MGRSTTSAPGAGAQGRPLHFCGDIDIRIAADGTWFHEGAPIGRKPLVKLFASVLQRDEKGDYWLVTPVERARIRVEDAPFVALEMTVEGSGRDQRLTFRTNVDDRVVAGSDHRLTFRRRPGTDEQAPYVAVRGGLEALVNRAVYYDLVELAVEETIDGGATFGVWSDGTFFPFAEADGLREAD